MFFSGQTFHICNYRIFTHIIRLIINGLHFLFLKRRKLGSYYIKLYLCPENSADSSNYRNN